jgi:hypothetical protein
MIQIEVNRGTHAKVIAPQLCRRKYATILLAFAFSAHIKIICLTYNGLFATAAVARTMGNTERTLLPREGGKSLHSSSSILFYLFFVLSNRQKLTPWLCSLLSLDMIVSLCVIPCDKKLFFLPSLCLLARHARESPCSSTLLMMKTLKRANERARKVLNIFPSYLLLLLLFCARASRNV